MLAASYLLVEGTGESRLQAGRDCLSVPTWHGTAVSVRRSATCRRTESAPAAFFNVRLSSMLFSVSFPA